VVLVVMPLLNLIVTALDIVAFFLMVRMVAIRWPNRSVLAFNTAGQTLVDAVLGWTMRGIRKFTDRSISPEAAIGVTLLAVCLIQCGLYCIFATSRP